MSLPVVSDSLDCYLSEISRYKLLTRDEEFKIAERYYKDRKVEDAHRLVTSNLRYVVKIALGFRDYGCRLSDLIQEGNMGLMVAVKKFDPYKGFRLITYATWWIKAFIQDFIVKTKGLVRHGGKALKKKLFYRDGAGQGAEHPAELSLDAPVADNSTTHLDMLNDTGPNQEEFYAEAEEQAVVGREITDAMARLNAKERLVIEKRVMAEEPESLQGLGDTLGLTRERIRQIESGALKKLKEALKDSPTVLAALPART